MSWRDDTSNSVAGTVGGTASPTTGTVTALTQENYLIQSGDRDREASSMPFSGLTTGTHIIYQVGYMAEGAPDDQMQPTATSSRDASRHPSLIITGQTESCLDPFAQTSRRFGLMSLIETVASGRRGSASEVERGENDPFR
jgi:hypothetical protein